MKAAILCWFFLSVAWTVTGEEVRFSNRLYVKATDTECSDNNYDDPKNTGSYLLSKGGQNKDLRTLSMDILLDHYASGNSQCFRAHPVFVDCVQTALSKLKRHDKRAVVDGGYRLPSDIGSSTAEEEVFATAGTALQLRPQSGNTNELLIIAQYLLLYCPLKLERIQRNMGIVMEAQKLHVFMGGPSDPPVFEAGGYMTQSSFIDEVVTAISKGLEMDKRASNCTRFTPLTSGQMFPINAASAEGTVGEMDVPVTRDSADFERLVQYLGTSVQFANDERSAAWCGQVGNPCVDCRNGPVDATLTQRCTARMMTSRMSNFLSLLQKLTAATLSDSVRVIMAWDEDYATHTASNSSLHREGRAILVTLVSGNTGNLGTLSQLAMCAEADFVQHNGDHLLIAVQKQHGEKASEVEFAQATMIRVDPPTSKDYLFSLPENFTESDHAEYPILDSAERETLQIASHTTVGMFLSSKTRYFRLNPFVVDCFSKLQDYFVKREDLDGPVTLEVLRGFLTTPERDATFTISDHRYVSGILGLSFEIRPNASLSTQNVSPATLARLAVTQCTPVFQDNDGAQIGVGLYSDRVYVDMRDSFKFWNPSGSFTSHVQNAAKFKTYITELFEAAMDGRIVEPDAPSEAKLLAEPVLRQDINYLYVTPERIKRSGSTTTVATGECQPATSTTFCQESQPFRNKLVDKGWAEATKKHNYHNEEEVKDAFYKCFRDCGTCLTGSVYEAKLLACSNYIHWSPFEIVPDGTAVNLFPRERPAMRKCACRGGSSSHCIENSALFLLMVNMFEATYRPDPTNSVDDDIYPQTENPSPMAELLNQLYVTHHEGVAKIWIQDDNDITSMKTTLEKLMVYNPNVTEVKIYVNETSTISAVESVMRTLILEWVTTSSPLHTREYVAPYTIEDMAPHCRITSKRSTQQHNVRDEIIAKINEQADRYLDFDL